MGTYIWDSYKISEAVISYTIFMNNGKMLPAGVCKVVETDLRTVCLCIFSYGGGFDGQGGRLDNFPVTAK